MSTWTPEDIARLRGYHGLGVAFSDIADILGRTRNACIGKANRLGLIQTAAVYTKNIRGAGEMRRGRGRGPVTNHPRPVKRRRFWSKPAPAAPRIALLAAPIDDNAIPLEQRKTLMELGHGDCRWPIGDPATPDFFFCSAPTIDGHPYCPGHSARAWVKAPSEERRAGTPEVRPVNPDLRAA